MSRAFSLYLDAVRLGCAIIVALWHFTGVFGGATFNASRIGIDAVMVFFVLSGYVISHTAEHKDKTLRVFAFNRATRIYSVAIPALAISLGLFYLGRSLGLEHYHMLANVEPSEPYRALLNMFFLSEFWVSSFRLQSNGPYWSLNYEVWYYILFGIAFFLRGRIKFATAGIVLLIMGPNLWALLPIWLAGHLLYRLQKNGPVPDRRVAWLCFAAPPAIYIVLHLLSAPQILRAWTVIPLGEMVMEQLIWNYVVGILTTVNFYGAIRLFGKNLGVTAPFARTTRFLAGYTFSIYLFHLPFLMYFAHHFAYYAQVIGVPFNSPPFQLGALAATFGSCFIVGTFTERKKSHLRSLLLSVHAKLTAKRINQIQCSL